MRRQQGQHPTTMNENPQITQMAQIFYLCNLRNLWIISDGGNVWLA